MENYWWLVIAIIVGLMGLVTFVFFLAREKDDGSTRRRLVPILLFGPFYTIFKRELAGRKTLLTKREMIGWVVVLVIAVLGVLLFPTSK